MLYFTTRSLPTGGRGIVDMITGEVVAEYTTGGDSFPEANEAARIYRVELMADLAGAGLIVDDGRQYALPVLQNAYQKFLTL
ncbi:MAG: hypothetical protein C0485_07890 [Pirellula sp.]|nr:hypothetical protein [Pirellula sp.]